MNKINLYRILNQIEKEIHSVIKNGYNRNKKFQHMMISRSFEAAYHIIDREL